MLTARKIDRRKLRNNSFGVCRSEICNIPTYRSCCFESFGNILRILRENINISVASECCALSVGKRCKISSCSRYLDAECHPIAEFMGAKLRTPFVNGAGCNTSAKGAFILPKSACCTVFCDRVKLCARCESFVEVIRKEGLRLTYRCDNNLDASLIIKTQG